MPKATTTNETPRSPVLGLDGRGRWGGASTGGVGGGLSDGSRKCIYTEVEGREGGREGMRAFGADSAGASAKGAIQEA